MGRDNVELGTTLSNLAELYRVQGRYAEAEPLQKRALSLREKSLGPNHPLVATSLGNLASLYEALGRDDDALQLLGRALDVREEYSVPPSAGCPVPGQPCPAL